MSMALGSHSYLFGVNIVTKMGNRHMHFRILLTVSIFIVHVLQKTALYGYKIRFTGIASHGSSSGESIEYRVSCLQHSNKSLQRDICMYMHGFDPQWLPRIFSLSAGLY